jgi:hypothetical protein
MRPDYSCCVNGCIDFYYCAGGNVWLVDAVSAHRPLAGLARDTHDPGKFSPALKRLCRFKIRAGSKDAMQ